MSLGEKKSIFYFNEEGKKNTEKVLNLVLERANTLNINKVLIFTSNGDTALKLRNRNEEIDIIAVSFPYNQELMVNNIEGEKQKIMPKTSDLEVHKELVENDIKLLQGTMPFKDIVIPGTRDTKKATIYHTLSLISGGLSFCVQSVIMATDRGLVNNDEEVIAMSADTAIVATGANTQWIFHPSKGMEIKEIICKPQKLSFTHEEKKEREE